MAEDSLSHPRILILAVLSADLRKIQRNYSIFFPSIHQTFFIYRQTAQRPARERARSRTNSCAGPSSTRDHLLATPTIASFSTSIISLSPTDLPLSSPPTGKCDNSGKKYRFPTKEKLRELTFLKFLRGERNRFCFESGRLHLSQVRKDFRKRLLV